MQTPPLHSTSVDEGGEHPQMSPNESNIKRIDVKRVYDPVTEQDGLRVLVDRLWPRGLRKDVANIDVWMKEIAPSPDLRTWFNHEPEKFAEFRIAYTMQLLDDTAHQAAIDSLLRLSESQPITLLYAAKDTTCNHAVVLRDVLAARQRQSD